jgi:hypothetical protein
MCCIPSKRDIEGCIRSPTPSLQTVAASTSIRTQASSEEVLSKLTKCWDEILSRPIPRGSTEKWRWQLDKDEANPVRFRPSVGELRIEFKNGRWYVIEGKKEKEIMVDSTVPKRVLADWKRRGNLNPEQWETAFLQNKTGINRDHLRVLKNILKTANITQSPRLKWPEPAPELIPLQQTRKQYAEDETSPPQSGNTEPMMSNQHELQTTTLPTVAASCHYWTTGLQFFKSWNSKPRSPPSVSADDRDAIRRATQVIKSGKQMVFITGAGISVAAHSRAFLTSTIVE